MPNPSSAPQATAAAVVLLPFLKPRASRISDVTFHPETGNLLGLCDDGTVHEWTITTGREVGLPFLAHNGIGRVICIDPNGSYTYTASNTRFISMHDLKRGSIAVRKLSVNSHVFDITVGTHTTPVSRDDDARDTPGAPETHTILGLACGDTAKICLPPRKAKRHRIFVLAELKDGSNSVCTRMSIGPQGKFVATASDNHALSLYRLDELNKTVGKPIQTFKPYCTIADCHKAKVNDVAFNQDGSLLASCDDKGVLCVRSFNQDDGTTEMVQRLKTTTGCAVNCVAFCHRGRSQSLLAAATSEGSMILWSTTDWMTLVCVKAHDSPIDRLAVDKTGCRIAINNGVILNVPDLDQVAAVACTSSPRTKRRTTFVPNGSGRHQQWGSVTVELDRKFQRERARVIELEAEATVTADEARVALLQANEAEQERQEAVRLLNLEIQDSQPGNDFHRKREKRTLSLERDFTIEAKIAPMRLPQADGIKKAKGNSDFVALYRAKVDAHDGSRSAPVTLKMLITNHHRITGNDDDEEDDENEKDGDPELAAADQSLSHLQAQTQLGWERYCLAKMPRHANILQLYGVFRCPNLTPDVLPERNGCGPNATAECLILEGTQVSLLTQITSLHAHRRLNRGSTLFPEPFFWYLMGQMLNGLAHLHSCGVVHRRILPQNILLTSGETDRRARVKLANFEHALLVSKTKPSEVAADAALTVGEQPPCYIAPEVREIAAGGVAVRDNQTIDQSVAELLAKADVFSVGMVACHMLSGFQDADNTQAPTKRLLHSRFQGAGYSAQCVDFVCSLLNPDAQARPDAKHALSDAVIAEAKFQRS